MSNYTVLKITIVELNEITVITTISNVSFTHSTFYHETCQYDKYHIERSLEIRETCQ